MPRLEAFLGPFVEALQTAEQKVNAQQYVSGLLSDLESKDAESDCLLCTTGIGRVCRSSSVRRSGTTVL